MSFSFENKKRFQDTRGQLNANIASMNMSKPEKGVSIESTDDNQRIWEWNRENIENGLKDEKLMYDRFNYVIKNIVMIEDQNGGVLSKLMSRYSGIDSSKPDVKQSDPFNSPIASDTSFGSISPARLSKNKKVVALATSYAGMEDFGPEIELFLNNN